MLIDKNVLKYNQYLQLDHCLNLQRFFDENTQTKKCIVFFWQILVLIFDLLYGKFLLRTRILKTSESIQILFNSPSLKQGLILHKHKTSEKVCLALSFTFFSINKQIGVLITVV